MAEIEDHQEKGADDNKAREKSALFWHYFYISLKRLP